jgi:C1A family cysteine protease
VNQEPQTTARLMGADPIDPVEMAKVPLIMSNEYRLAQTTSSTNYDNLRKPVKPPVNSTDVTPPTVTITSPANGSSFTSSVTITANSTDNVGVTSLTFSVNGTTATFAASSYSWTWNSGTAANGNYTVYVTAEDAAGNQATASVTVAKNATITVPPSGTLPTSYALVMPAVQNQGGEGSCIAFASAYARDYEAYKRSGATSYSLSSNVLSPAYLFNQTKSSSTCSGSALLTTFNFLKSNGICTWNSMPYVDGACTVMPTSTQTAEAANYRIPSYSQVYATDVTAIKTMLVANHPLVSQYSVDNQFYNAKAGFIWTSFTGLVGYHALAICGYDDSKQAFKVINQWGTSWGDSGYSWIAYNLLPTVSSSLLVMNY